MEQHSGISEEPLLSMLVKTIASNTGKFRTEPGYAQILGLSAMLTGTSGSQLRLLIEPLTAGSRYWAFVAVTNNSTQQVTTVSP